MTAKIIGALHTEMALNRSKRLLKLTGRRRGGGERGKECYSCV